jgi:2-dehydro-3-deoxygluconokinase
MPNPNVPAVVAIGEAMIELAPVANNLFQRCYAGDTFNTLWHMAQLLGNDVAASFVTRVGQDKLSDDFVESLKRDSLEVSAIGRDVERIMGLYMIELDGVERHFQYWRESSAARRLADDPTALEQAVDGANLIHLSGITLAILSETARATLFDVLTQARKAGSRVSFDPNIRPRLWRDRSEIRDTVSRFLTITDIALPSFDDEAANWGDATPEATVKRLAAAGVNEIAVKNGAGAILFREGRRTHQRNTPPVIGIKDTTGAGDAFNAGYLATRLRGLSQEEAVYVGQALSAQVIRTSGALLPKRDIVNLLAAGLLERKSKSP